MSSETTQTVSVYDVLAWLETNKKSLAIGFMIAVVVGFGVAIYRHNAEQKELAASDALLKLKASVGADESVTQPDASAYLKVAEQFPGTSAAERALLLGASALFSEGKYSEAQAQFSKFLQEYPQSPFAATAAYGVAASQEAQGKLDEALPNYQNLTVRYPSSNVLDDAKLAVARIYEAKKQPEMAFRMYSELAKPGAMTTASAEAAARKQELLVKHPELGRTNTVPSSFTTVTNLAGTSPSSTPRTSATNSAGSGTNKAVPPH